MTVIKNMAQTEKENKYCLISKYKHDFLITQKSDTFSGLNFINSGVVY